ncbi:hypothetical protein SAMN04489727_1977 [Amycolatopsis tolypomycina]|uniref:Uncharacterized protein n=1 Tax=Amycolatopsis tolypomycina TaxID=208445 RepID=A0A1H4JLT4_9PSEU|nr:hypothetical protein [Amycolatopsis tolypomycina]SEB46658.1 hypothetical protein SAMN04489727_1977 [Amycolatopsis tolypomycina]
MVAPGEDTRRTARPPRRRRILVVLGVLLAAALGALATANAAPAPAPAPAAQSGRLAPQQVPPLPLPPNPSCASGSPEPACHLPTASPPRTIPATPLPPITTLPGPGPSCFPGSVLPGCAPSLDGPCTGPDCIPQPSTLAPSTPPPAPIPNGPGGDAAECGLTDLTGCMVVAASAMFAAVVAAGLNPLLDLLGKTLLTTPEPDQLPGLGAAWTGSWHILLTAYVVLVLLAGLIIMAYQTLQTRYTVKELAPRLVVGFLAGTLSLFLATKGIQIANALSAAVLGDGVDPAAMTRSLVTMVQGSLHGGGLFLGVLGLVLVALLLVLLVVFVVRVIVTVLLIAAAPIALMFHALPHTEGVAIWWWKGYGGVLAIQVGQSLTLVVTVRIFFAPGGFTVLGPTPSALMNVLLCIALLYVLIKIPFWFLAPLRSGRPSLLGRIVRGVLAYKTMGLLSGATAALRGRSRGRNTGPHGRGDPSGGPPPADPPSTRTGQFMLPMRVRRTRPGAPRSPRLGDLAPTDPLTDRGPGPGQLPLFTAAGSGERRRVAPNPRALPPRTLPNALPRDQLGLPITTRHAPDLVGRRSLADDLADRPPAPPPVHQTGLLTPDGRINRNARPPASLPNALIAPETGMLPIHLRPAAARPPRHTLADTAAPPPVRQTGPGLITPSGQINRAARAPRRRPRDAYTGNRPLASGQYPLPLGVRRQPKPAPPPEHTATPPPAAQPRRVGVQLPLPLDLPKRPRRAPAPKKK